MICGGVFPITKMIKGSPAECFLIVDRNLIPFIEIGKIRLCRIHFAEIDTIP
jgi:hypothetical protein